MNGPEPPDFREGDQLSARWLNRLLGFLRSLVVRSDGSILVEHRAGYQVLRVNLPQEVDAVITGGANPYTATEVRGAAGGTWSTFTGGRSFSADGLYERNANTGVPTGTYVHARRDRPSGKLIFDRGPCPE